MRLNCRLTRARSIGLMLVAAVAVSAALPLQAQQQADPAIYARIGERSVTVEEFVRRLRNEAREKYWHSGVPEEEREDFERQVLDLLVDEGLLRDEALRRGIEPDADLVERRLVEVEVRYQTRSGWEEFGDAILAEARGVFETESLLERLESTVRKLPPASDAEVRDYYEVHPEKFTEPEQVRIAVILLRVDPSSTSSVWDETKARMSQLRDRILAGEAFEGLAREYSDDITAAAGGDMGYAHAGSLGEGLEAAVAGLQPGEMTEPLFLLEGVALVRLIDRVESTKHPFSKVAERARALAERDQQDEAWASLRARLREGVEIEVFRSLLQSGGEG